MQEIVDGRITVTRLKKMPMLANPPMGPSIVSITAASVGDVSGWGLLWVLGSGHAGGCKRIDQILSLPLGTNFDGHLLSPEQIDKF